MKVQALLINNFNIKLCSNNIGFLRARDIKLFNIFANLI